MNYETEMVTMPNALKRWYEKNHCNEKVIVPLDFGDSSNWFVELFAICGKNYVYTLDLETRKSDVLWMGNRYADVLSVLEWLGDSVLKNEETGEIQLEEDWIAQSEAEGWDMEDVEFSYVRPTGGGEWVYDSSWNDWD